MKLEHYFSVTIILYGLVIHVHGAETDSVAILMPGVQPEMNETYLCKGIQVEEKQFIVGFTPNATMRDVHHMLLYGCETPGSRDEVWNCGDMATGHQHGLHSSGPCSRGSQIVYAWARNAPALDLPEGVAFAIGPGTEIQYITVQVHYTGVSSFQDGHKDSSGVILHYTTTPQPKSAGVIVLVTSGHINPNSTEHMETACTVQEDKEIHPFAFRTHTHELGRVVAGYQVRRDENEMDNWTLIGKKNPMTAQMFYPVANNLTVKSGDILASRCTMVNERKTVTTIGSTSEHEMCNFYIMYWINGSSPLQQKVCSSAGPPSYYWHTGSYQTHSLNNLPSGASTP